MSKRETTRTIVMLASKLARSESKLRRCRSELNFAQDTNRELERELAEYRKEEGERAAITSVEPFPERPPIVVPPSGYPLALGAAIEVMCRRPGLELIDDDGYRHRVRSGVVEYQSQDFEEWLPLSFAKDTPELTFRIAEGQDV